MQNLKQYCQDLFHTDLGKSYIKINKCEHQQSLAEKYMGYPIFFEGSNQQEYPGISVFVIIDLKNETAKCLHNAISDQKLLTNLFDRMQNKQAAILQEIVTGENEINIENQIEELEDYDFYYDSLVENGVIKTGSNPIDELKKKLRNIQNQPNLLKQFKVINSLGFGKFQTILIMLKSYVK